MASSNHAKFHASITKVNNSAIFWTITAVLAVFATMNGEGAQVLVVSALKAISNEQIEELNHMRIAATEVGINDQKDEKIFSLLFLSSQLYFLGIRAVLDLRR